MSSTSTLSVWFLTLWFGMIAVPCTSTHAAKVESLRLVPFPKVITLHDGAFALDRPLILQSGLEPGCLAVQQILSEMRRARLQPPRTETVAGMGHELRIIADASEPGAPVDLSFRDDAGDEDYALHIAPAAIVIRGHGPAGTLYGSVTLCQLIRANRVGDHIPCLNIRDWPSMQWRAFQDDLTRGPSSTLDELKHEVALGAGLKLNLFTYYMEHQFAFASHPDIGPPEGSLLPGDLKALVEAARPQHVEVLGNQQSFGHFGHILKHKQFEALRETGGILNPVNEDTYRLLDDLYGEVMPLLPLGLFNVCCDETEGLGTGPAKALAAEIGVGGVYTRHIRRVYDLVKGKYGKRMMMWGDIILTHPEHLSEIPKDVIMLTWGYEPQNSFEAQILPFAQSGYDFFVCPGVNNWNRMLPDFAAATTNIRHFVRDGVKHRARGMINTAWDDDGETLNAPNWHGFAWGAECAWSGAQTTPELFNRRVGAVLFGEKGDHFGQAIEQLSEAFRLPGMQRCFDARFWALEFKQPCGSVRNARAEANRLLAIVQPALAHLQACREEAIDHAELLDAFIFAAQRLELIGRRTLDGVQAAEHYQSAYEQHGLAAAGQLEQARRLIEQDGRLHRAMAERFAELWRRENRPYALDVPMQRYQQVIAQYDDLATKLAAAQRSLEAGQPLPAPGEIGLELRELSRRPTRVHRVEVAPLQPEAPWMLPGSHRLGLVLNPSAFDRMDVPIELLVPLPPEATRNGVRALACIADGKPIELPAQLDAAGDSGMYRLTTVVTGALPRDARVVIQVYLGLPAPAPDLPNAVRTGSSGSDARWLSNDRVHLLLSPEGAHLYQWQMKDVGGRDATLPGETGYAGFADVGGEHRSTVHELTCTASGPALVRYACTSRLGLTKTISLFAGASWVEVTIDPPTTYYWDFDDPANFAAESPTPGEYLFSNGRSGKVGKLADGAAAQVRTADARWGVKYRAGEWALGMIVPEEPVGITIGPGGGWGGVGVEQNKPVAHVISYAGVLSGAPADLMNRLQHSLSFRDPPGVVLHALQVKP